jgi:hypothetical protein
MTGKPSSTLTLLGGFFKEEKDPADAGHEAAWAKEGKKVEKKKKDSKKKRKRATRRL